MSCRPAISDYSTALSRPVDPVVVVLGRLDAKRSRRHGIVGSKTSHELKEKPR